MLWLARTRPSSRSQVRRWPVGPPGRMSGVPSRSPHPPPLAPVGGLGGLGAPVGSAWRPDGKPGLNQGPFGSQALELRAVSHGHPHREGWGRCEPAQCPLEGSEEIEEIALTSAALQGQRLGYHTRAPRPGPAQLCWGQNSDCANSATLSRSGQPWTGRVDSQGALRPAAARAAVGGASPGARNPPLHPQAGAPRPWAATQGVCVSKDL